MHVKTSSCFLALTVSLALFARRADAASGTWNGTQNDLWTNSANWSASPYAGFNTGESAAFNSAGNNNTNLNIVGLYSLEKITFDTASVAAYTIGTGEPNSQRIVIGNTGNYKLTSTAANSQTFNCAVMLGGGATSGSYTFQNDNTGYSLTFNAVIVTNTGTPGTKALTVAGAGDTTILGHITKGTAASITLTKSGTGRLALCGTNVIRTLSVTGGTLALTGASGAMAISGAVSVASGALLRLDNTESANNLNRLVDTAPVTLSGGTLDFSHAGGAADYSETAGPVTLNASGCVISAAQADAGRTSALTLSHLTVNAGASVNFVGPGLGASDRNRIFIAGQADGPLSAWATLNSSSPVLYDSANGVYLQPSTDIAAYGSTIVSNDDAFVRINSEGAGGDIALSDPVTVIGSLTQNTGFDATVATSGKTLRLSAVAINAAMAGLTLGASPNDGTVTPKAEGGTLSLVNDSDSALTLNAVVADNAAPSPLAKSGTGTAVLAGANTFSGPVTVSGGTLLLAHSQALQNVLLGSLSGIVFDSSVASHAFIVGNLTNAFALTLEDNAANPITLSVGNNNGSSTFGGVLGGGGSLNKVGAGKLTLTVASTNTGGTFVSAGILRAAHSGSLGTGGVTNNATLELPQGAVTYTGLSTSLSGTGTVHVTLGTGTATTYLDGDYSGFSGVWNIGVGAAAGAGKLRMNGTDNPAAVLNVLTNATLYAAAPGVHTATAVLHGGNMGQSYGQLRLDNDAEWAGPVVLAGDITDTVDGFFGCYEGTGTVSGVISDLGGAHPVKKLNGTLFNLTCPTNTYAGQTWISNGRLGAMSLRNVGETSSLGQPANADDGTIKLGSGGNTVALLYLGSGDTSDRVIDLAGTTGGVTIEQAGSGPLTFTSGFAYSGAGGSRTLTLDGSTAGTGELMGVLTNSASGTLALRKNGTGRWTLSGANTYGGSTVVNNGELVLSGANGALRNTSGFTVYTNGVLRLANTGAANNADRLADTKALALTGGGTLDFSHTAGVADYSESVGAITVAGAGNVIRTARADSGQTSALTLASLARNANATLDFQSVGLGADDRNRVFIGGQTPGLLGLWATYNGTGLAAYDPARGVFAGTASSTNIAARGPSVIPDEEDADVRIAAAGEDGPITLAGATETRVGRLQQCTNVAAVVDTAFKTLRAHALQINTNQASLTIGPSEGDGTLTALLAGGRIDLINDDASAALTVNASLPDNGAASSLVKSGPGDVILRGAAAYTGPTAVNNGTLTFGGHLAPQTVNGVISGAGSLAKSGTNLLHLLAANTYTGPTYINQGVARVNQNSAFGSAAGGVFIADGATLDVGCTPDVGGIRAINALNMQSEPLTVQGAGADGLGAIINSSTGSQYNALGKITLAGDTVFGGLSRWDVRDSWFVMNDRKLTKIGPNTFSLSSTTNAPGEAGLASIDVQEGQFRLQRSATLNGSADNTLTVRGGAEFELYELVNDVPWSLSLDAGSALDVLGSTTSAQNRMTGPATLNGEVSLVGGDGYYATLAGDLSGPGSLVKTNGSYFIITGTNNTYAGTTLIRGGTLTIASLRNVGEPSSLGQPADATAGTIPVGSGATSGRLTYIGTGDATDRVLDLAGTTGGATLNHSGEGLLNLRNVTASGGGTKTLYLEGSTSGVGEISSAIPNGPSGTVALNKSGTGVWTLSGNNTYSGNTTMGNGTLTFSGNNTCSGSTTVSGGILSYSGTNTLGSLAINAGAVTVSGTNAHGVSGILVGGSSGKNGSLTLGPGSSLSCGGSFRVGNTGANGALFIDGGAFLNTASDGDQNFVFARENNAYGYLRMTGGSVTATRFQMSGVTGSSNIGRSLARILGGTLSFSAYVLIGRNPGCETVLTLDGGTLNHANASRNVGVPWAGGRAELNVTGGSVDNTGRSVTFLEGGGTYGTGIVNLCAGTLTTDSVTNYASSVALINFAGGTLKAGANRSDFLPSRLSGVYSFGPFGAYAGGAVIDTDGKAVSVSAPLQAPTGQGVYAVEVAEQGSGYLGEPYVSIEGDGVGATAVANLADDGTGRGTYKVAYVTVTCPGINYSAAPAVLFKGGGATNALVAALPGAVTLADNASGGLTKQGDGTLTLDAANTYGGATTVAGGTLKLGHAAALPTGTQVTLAGGTLDLSGTTVTNAVNGSGTLANGFVQTVLSPAGEGVTGDDTITLSDATLTGCAYLADVSPDGTGDHVTVAGNIDLSGFALWLVETGQLNRHQSYTLLTCTGARTGAFASANLPNRWHLSYQADGSVKLLYAGGTLIRIR